MRRTLRRKLTLRGARLPFAFDVKSHITVVLSDDKGVVDHWELVPSRGHRLTFYVIDDPVPDGAG